MRIDAATIEVDRGTRLGNLLEAMNSLYGANPETKDYGRVLADIETLTARVHLIADTAKDEAEETQQ